MLRYLLLLSFALFIISCQDEEPEIVIVDPEPEVECYAKEQETFVIDALNKNGAFPFSSSDPNSSDEDIEPLIDYLADSKIVGLGEASHGTKEFYEMKDKIFRALVTKHGFRAIVFEIPWGNCYKINQYVTKGISNAEDVLQQS